MKNSEILRKAGDAILAEKEQFLCNAVRRLCNHSPQKEEILFRIKNYLGTDASNNCIIYGRHTIVNTASLHCTDEFLRYGRYRLAHFLADEYEQKEKEQKEKEKQRNPLLNSTE